MQELVHQYQMENGENIQDGHARKQETVWSCIPYRIDGAFYRRQRLAMHWKWPRGEGGMHQTLQE